MNKRSLTEGPVFRGILWFSLPVLGCGLLQQFYTLIDTALVGHMLGDVALAAVGNTTFLCALLVQLSTGLTSGFAIHTARDWGKGDGDSLRKTVAASLALTVGITLLLTVAGVLGLNGILGVMRTPAEIFADSRQFLLINVLGLIATMLYNLATAFLRSVGKSAVPLVILVCCLGVNLLLALLFLVVLRWGVWGVALATVLAQTLSALASWGYLLKTTPELHVHWCDLQRAGAARFGTLLRAGFAMMLCVAIPELGSVVLQVAVNTMGTVAIGAYTVGRRLVNVTMAPLNAISIAMATYVSQNDGAGKPERVRRGLSAANVMCLAWTGVSIAAVLLFSHPFAAWISGSDSGELLAYASQYMIITDVFYPFVGVVLLYRQTLQSLGNQLVPVLCSALEVAIKVVVVLFAADGGSFLTVCLTEPATWVVNSVILLGCYGFAARRKLRRPTAECPQAPKCQNLKK